MTDLFLFGVPAPAPPSCAVTRGDPPSWNIVGDHDAVLELPPLMPHAGVTRVLPSLSIQTASDYSFRFDARLARAQGWVPAAIVGPDDVAAGEPQKDDVPSIGAAGVDGRLLADIDVFTSSQAIQGAVVRVRLHAADLDRVLAAPMLLSVSFSTATQSPVSTLDLPDERPVRLSVPVLSQMECAAEIRSRICSPTSVAMVLAYWGKPVSAEVIAGEIHDARLDRYGVWPAAIRAAARRGVIGYLLPFPSWEAAAWCLREGLPVIASIRYRPGELAGAAIESTTGHLIVLTGFDGERVFVNDPAGESAADVSRAYVLSELIRAWLVEGSGVGYVLFRPPCE